MSRWALIRGGVVDTVVEQDGAPVKDGWLVVAVDGLAVGPGWRYDDGSFVAPRDLVPEEVSRAQALIVLDEAGITPSVAGAIAAIEDPVIRNRAQRAWEHSNFFKRYGEMVTMLAPQLGLSEAQLDALFIAAKRIGL